MILNLEQKKLQNQLFYGDVQRKVVTQGVKQILDGKLYHDHGPDDERMF